MKRYGSSSCLRAVLLVIFVSMLTVTSSARAASIGFLTADEPAVNDGAVAYLGGETPLFGDTIHVDLIFGIDTPLNDGLASGLACVGCSLSFVTGNRLPIPGIYLFGGGGVLSVTGAVPGAGIAAPDTLLVGGLSGAFALDLSPDATFLGGVVATFQDLKNAALTDYFGLPQGQTWNGIFAMGLAGIDDPSTGQFVAGVYGFENGFAGAVINIAAVPEPQTWLLFALGVVGIAARVAARRKSLS